MRLSVLALLCLLAGCGAPGIPHAITSRDDSSCLGCHEAGKDGAPRMPHSKHSNCTGCHTPTK